MGPAHPVRSRGFHRRHRRRHHPLTYLADVYRLYLKRELSRTGSRTKTDVAHAKVYTKFQKRVKGCTIPLLADNTTHFNRLLPFSIFEVSRILSLALLRCYK
jgi:hypothetical protein